MANSQEFTFDVEADRKAAAAQGNSHSLTQLVSGEENRFNTSETGSDMGLTTDTPDFEAARKLDIEHPEPEVDEPTKLKEENEYLKRKLGEQGQQFGERFGQLQAQLAAIAAAQAKIQPAAQTQPIDPSSVDFFKDIPDDQKFMSPSERTRLNQVLATYAVAVDGRIKQSEENSTYVSARLASGITDEDEARITQSNPWISRLTGLDRANAVKALAESARKSKETPGRVADEAARLAARREAYTEPTSRVSADATTSQEPAIEKLTREFRSGKMSLDQMKQALRKVGIGTMDDYGRVT